MNPYLKKLETELAVQQEHTVSESLYFYYREYHPTDSDAIARYFSDLNNVLAKLTLTECDQVWDLVCSLCGEHQREGFLEGFRVGANLIAELRAHLPQDFPKQTLKNR